MNERDKYVDVEYSITRDLRKSTIAREANNLHYLDAALVAEILEKFEILTIHDCFGVRLCELHLFMDNVNRYYSDKIGKETYSIHVVF